MVARNAELSTYMVMSDGDMVRLKSANRKQLRPQTGNSLNTFTNTKLRAYTAFIINIIKIITEFFVPAIACSLAS